MLLRFLLFSACLLISATVTAQDWYAVTDPLDADEPVARISSPGDSADIVVADVTEPVAILGQATDSHYSYDAAGRLAQIRHQKADGSALAQYSYQRDAKGRLTRATEETGGQTTNKSWEYDADGKLTQESISAAGTTRTCRYSHDSTGNRTEKDCDGQKTRYAYNSLDQLTEEQTATGPKTTYRWDGRGNLIEKSTPAATIRYEWSSDNRLLKASDGSTSIRYGYDALGRRISRTQETGGQKQETQWILDTARPYSEIVLERSRQNGGAWQETRYTHTPDGVGQLISEQRQGKTLHVYEDGQGSARLITDESGQIIETLDFDAFGNEEAGNPQESRHRYTGESYDSATGLYHLRARDYDPKTGRFISMDEHPGSQSIPLTLNKYLYGNADPVNHMDPGGNIFISITMPSFGNIWRFSFEAGRALSIIDKLDIALTKLQLLVSIMRAIDHLDGPEWRRAYHNAKNDSGFLAAMSNFDSALADLASNSGKIFMGIMAESNNPIKQFVSNQKNSLLIYGSTPEVGTPWPGSTRIDPGTISLSKSQRKIKLELGKGSNQRGRMLGVGHTHKLFRSYSMVPSRLA